MNLKKDSTKASAKRALSLRNSARFNSKIYLERPPRMLHKKSYPAWFLRKVDKACWHKLKNIVKLIILRRPVATQSKEEMLEEVIMICSHRLISLLALADKWWPVTTTLAAMALQWIQVKVVIILALNKDWRVLQWIKEYKEDWDKTMSQVMIKVTSNTLVTQAI